ncbi:MAG: 30S ribosomal protein S20 [Bacteriovoracia bacterium]
MANTRQSAKRSRQALKRQTRNIVIRSEAKTVLKNALQAIQKKDVEAAKAAYAIAVKTMAKAVSKGAVPGGRASRKVSRLTHFAMKTLPEVLPFKVNTVKKSAEARK